MNTKRKKTGRKLLSFLLTLALVLGLMPGMSLTAYAAPTEKLLTTITATGKEQASYSTENVATVSFSYTANGYSRYTNNGTTATWGWWGYGWTATVTPADGYTITKCVFYDDKDRTATDSEAPFVVETTEEDKTPKVNGTPILANQSKGITKIEVYGYATPAIVDPVPYMAWNGSTLEEKDGDNACKTYTVVTVDTTAFEDGKWYVVSDNVTVSSRITVTGTAHLILCDGATLTASKGITVNNGNTINIYAQSGGTGELNAGSDTSVASIGGGYRGASSGTVNIHGGKITATGGTNASGIGGALEGGNGEVNIYSGEVTAQGQNFAAGIGGYSGKSGGTVNIYGGTVNASGSQYGTTGIGIGGTNPGNCVVHIYGGEVTATSEKAAAGIQGTVTIDGGTVTATGGVSDSISSFGEETYSSNGINGTVTVNGGTVTATGGNVTANGYMGAIESYGGAIYACSGINGTVTISGGTVTATGGNVTGDINNYGGTIYACNGVNGTVTISGGTVTATGGSHTGNSSGTTVKEKGFGGSLTLGTGMYLYGGTSANPESNLSNYRAGAGDYTGDRYVYMTVNNVVPHIHSFTYTADGATVTATCGAEGCDLTSNPTLTIVAPTLTTYGQTGEGISEKATLDGLDAFNSATDLTVAASDIKYYGVEEYEIEGHTYKKQGDELAQVPTAAGEYVAGLTLSNVKTSETETGDVIARVWYTIAPASISSVTVTDITAPVATEALDTEAATSTANVTLGAVTWNPTTTPAAYATQYTATVIATAAANYAFADTVTATVNGQAATVTKNDGGTLTIAYTFEKTALTPVTITATDKKADWSADGIAIPVEGMFTITEGAGAATYTVTNGTGEGTYDAQTGKLTVTKCGTFTVKVSTAATDTYAAGAETTATLTVNKVDSTAATVTANTLIYTGSAQALVTVTGEATGGTMQYALGTKDAATEEYTPSIPTGTDAGTYYVWYKVIGDANHNDSEAGFVEAKINPVDKTDLNKAIEEAEAYYNSIKDNSDYSEQKDALGSAISTAKLLAGNDNVTAAEVSEGITAVNSAKATAETAVEGIIESNKEAFTAEKATQKNNADALAKDGDSDASRKLIEDAKKAIDAIDFDNTKTLDDNKAALADIITKLTDNLTTQRAADKLAADKAAFEVEKTTKQKAADALSEELDSDASKKLITDAKAAIEALTYDETKSLDENKAAIEAVITSLKTDLGTQRAEDLATNKEAFGADKETQKKAADALAADGDSDASKRLIEDAKKAIDEPAYDETKSLDENKAALAAIVSKLKEDLTTQRAADKKEADDTAAAKKVTDAINALPAKEDVTSSDKEAVEAARAAYNALTASQKDKIDTVTLKKLTDAEEALVALGELDKNVVAFNSEKNVQKAEAVKLAKEDDSDAVRKLIADAREAIDALAYDKNKSLDENKAALAAIVTELGNALEEQRELEKILAVVKIDQGETVAEVDKTAIREEDVETVTNVAKSTAADLSEAATTCVKQIVEESETVEDNDKNIVIVPALDVKGKEYSVTETDATMTLDIEAVYTSYETTSDITTAADVKSATEAEDKTEKAKVKEIGSGKLDTEGTPVNVKIEVPAAFAGVLGATTETVKASPATIYVKHTHKNKNYEYNASLYCEGSKYFVEFVNPNGFSPFTLSGNSASVASIGDKNYTDLQSAIDDAADGSTIKLTNDNDVSATINTEKTITIDKDNHTGNVDIKAADTLLLTKTDNENGTTTYKTVTKYKVTFDNNGGKGTMPAQEIGGTAALNANAFTKEGYTFDGWNTTSDGSGTAYADKADVTPAADMTLYAQWKENPKPDDKDKTDAAVEAVKTKINALKAAEKITTADKAAVEAADKAYDALSEAQKKLIDAATLKKLTDAKEALKAAEKAESDKAAADAVKTKINALKAADKITTADKAAIEAARKAYDALSADQKKLVDAATLKKLTDTEKALTTAEANDKVAKELEAAKQEAQAAMNEQVTVTQKGNKFTVKWKKASSADGYYVYAQYCGKKATKPVKTIKKNSTTKTTITKIDGKKINQKKNFRVYVAPYKIVDGKKVTLGKSMTAHLVGSKNTKYSNVKKLTLTKSKYTVKVGKTAKIKAKVTLVNKNKKHIPKSHGAKFRYKSSDTSIANVDKNGKIKGIKKGTCTIYVYSINGLMKKAKVTVK